MKAGKKIAAKLERRMRDYSLMMDNRKDASSKVQARKDSGGFHRPGSMQK